MTRKVYDLCGADDLRFSPNCWRIRLALAHKGLETEFAPWNFTDKEAIAFSGSTTVPVLVDGEETIVGSWNITCYLEDSYPDTPSYFGGEAGRAVTGFINAWTDSTLHPALVRCIVTDVHERLDPVDQDYFREIREARFGKTLEEMRDARAEFIEALEPALKPLQTILHYEAWISGDAPAYADYLVFGAFQWARLVSPVELLKKDSPISGWRERMLDLFDGLARTQPAAG